MTMETTQNIDYAKLNTEIQKLKLKSWIYGILLILGIIIYELHELRYFYFPDYRINYIVLAITLLISCFLCNSIFQINNIKLLQYLLDHTNRLNLEINRIKLMSWIYGIGFILSWIIETYILWLNMDKYYIIGGFFIVVTGILFLMNSHKIDYIRYAQWEIFLWFPAWFRYGLFMFFWGLIYLLIQTINIIILPEFISSIIAMCTLLSIFILIDSLIQYLVAKNIQGNRLYKGNWTTVLIWGIVVSIILVLFLFLIMAIAGAAHV